MNDGMPLYSTVHPQPPFLKRVWGIVKGLLGVRPKFSKDNLEPI